MSQIDEQHQEDEEEEEEGQNNWRVKQRHMQPQRRKRKGAGGWWEGGVGAILEEEAGAGGQLLLCLPRRYRSSPDVERQIGDCSEREGRPKEGERQQRDVSDRGLLPTAARLESSCVFYKSHESRRSSLSGSQESDVENKRLKKGGKHQDVK